MTGVTACFGGTREIPVAPTASVMCTISFSSDRNYDLEPSVLRAFGVDFHMPAFTGSRPKRGQLS